jgi:hypothetical protein
MDSLASRETYPFRIVRRIETHDYAAEDLPPHWDPPPRVGYGETSPELLTTTIAINASDSAHWFLQLYVDKVKRKTVELARSYALFVLDDHDLEGLIALLPVLDLTLSDLSQLQTSIDNQSFHGSIEVERAVLLERLKNAAELLKSEAMPEGPEVTTMEK